MHLENPVSYKGVYMAESVLNVSVLEDASC